MNASSKLWLVPAAVLIAAGIASFVAQLFFLPGDVEAEDWRIPAEYVLEHIEPDDVVTVQPSWNEDPYPYLTDVGDQVIRQHQPLIEDVHHRSRIWLLVETSRLDEAISLMPYAPTQTKAFDGITVVRMDAPSKPTITYDLLERLAEAEVSHRDGDKVIQQCKNWRERDRTWHCGKPNKWIYVGEEILFLGRDPHQCIWTHPPAKGKTVRLRYADVPLGERFRLRAGLNERAARSKRGTDVHVRVAIGDEFSSETTIPARQTSWEPIDIDTSKLADQTRDVLVEVQSPKVFDRYLCLNGWVFQDE